MGVRILGSMLAGLITVNAFAVDSKVKPIGGDKTFFNELTDYVMKMGDDWTVPAPLAKAIGLPGEMPSRSFVIGSRGNGKEIDGLACFVTYEETSGSAQQKKPTCIILMRHRESGQDHNSHYYVANLEGKLLKAIYHQGKSDQTGNSIRGSADDNALDIKSPAVKKDFEAAMKEAKAWLEKQQKKLTANERSNQAKSKTTPLTAPTEPIASKP